MTLENSFQRDDRRALERAGMKPKLAAQIVALPVADNLADASWTIACPWCCGKVNEMFLHDASLILARHIRGEHRWEMGVLEISLTHLRRKDAEQEAKAAA